MRFPLRAYFYPRPPRGGRRFVEFFIGKLAEFLSTPSARRATRAATGVKADILFLSTPSARRATGRCGRCRWWSRISIHALREEGDAAVQAKNSGTYTISIHALREEGDLNAIFTRLATNTFLSTPSARRATSARLPICRAS